MQRVRFSEKREEGRSKKRQTHLRLPFFGRSDWIRTSGHLNPIQVLYQTEPHPDTTEDSIHYFKEKCKPFFKKFPVFSQIS